MSEHDLPAWSLPSEATAQIAVQSSWPKEITRDWAYGGSTGAGARVCILDSGVEAGHPLVGDVQSAVVVTKGEDGEPRIDPDTEGDVCGHGSACAGIVRALAPEAEIHSVRVLGPGYTGSGKILLAGLKYAIDEGFDIVNMSLSTTKSDHAAVLHELADAAYFKRTVLVASAHNMPVESYPWRFSSVISVGSHMEEDPMVLYYNPNPPVEFFARVDLGDRGCLDGETLRCTGPSFATPHVAGICALIRSKHPELTPFELKSLLHLTSRNVADRR
jgi:subtilisin family serine protease